MSCNLITHSLFPGSRAINRAAKIYCLSFWVLVPSFLQAHPWRLFRGARLEIFLIRPSLRPCLRYDAEMLRIFIACPRHGQNFLCALCCVDCKRERERAKKRFPPRAGLCFTSINTNLFCLATSQIECFPGKILQHARAGATFWERTSHSYPHPHAYLRVEHLPEKGQPRTYVLINIKRGFLCRNPFCSFLRAEFTQAHATQEGREIHFFSCWNIAVCVTDFYGINKFIESNILHVLHKRFKMRYFYLKMARLKSF